MWLPIRKGMMRLVWNFQIHTLDQQHVYDFTVDAESARFGHGSTGGFGSISCLCQTCRKSESCNTQPPADGRTLVNNPANATASPFNWHDTNVVLEQSYDNTGKQCSCLCGYGFKQCTDAGSSPNGGTTLNFDFPINLNSAPGSYQNAVVANLSIGITSFMMCNINTVLTRRPATSRPITTTKAGWRRCRTAEAQDGSGTNNANFMTPADGTAPRMQMYLWNRTVRERWRF